MSKKTASSAAAAEKAPATPLSFVVNSSQLLRHLQKVGKVLTNNPVVPIMEDFLLEVMEGKLTVTASDLQNTLITRLDAESSQPVRLAIPGKLLLETLSALPAQPITFTLDAETFSATITTDNGRYKLSGDNPSDYPRLPDLSNAKSMELPASQLANALHLTVPFMSRDEMRPAMTGLHVVLKSSGSTFVATDGHRLSKVHFPFVESTEEASFIANGKALRILSGILPNNQDMVDMNWNRNLISFRFGDTQLICKLIDERYPDYENAIPTLHPNEMEVERVPLVSALKRLILYADHSTYIVAFTLEPGQPCIITTQNYDYGHEAKETLPATYTGTPLTIGFNVRLLLETLSVIDCDRVEFRMSQPNRACLIVPEEQDSGEDLLLLVMPVMLDKYI